MVKLVYDSSDSRDMSAAKPTLRISGTEEESAHINALLPKFDYVTIFMGGGEPSSLEAIAQLTQLQKLPKIKEVVEIYPLVGAIAHVSADAENRRYKDSSSELNRVVVDIGPGNPVALKVWYRKEEYLKSIIAKL